jgi:outer membrane protein assembly factor BamA
MLRDRFARMRRLALWLCLLMLAAIGVAYGAEPTAEEPAPWWRWLDPRSSPFIPVPVVGTDPNSGTTVGIMPVFLENNENREIDRIIAPDFVYNPILGYGAHARLLAYPSRDTQWEVEGKLKQRIEHGLEAAYGTGLTREARWSYSGHLLYDRTATYRFFGIGNDSPRSAQTNYTNEQVQAEGVIGWNVTRSWQLGLLTRARFVQIEPGALTNLPFIGASFPDLPGVGAEHDFFNRGYVSYDTVDSTSLPTTGTQVAVTAGATRRGFLSSASYSVVTLDVRHYEPLPPRATVAGHVALRYMPQASGAPFWALSRLGGDRSVIGEEQPLRGYGEGRFVDRNLVSAGAELRTRVWDVNLFSTRVTLQLAPFFEVGKVFAHLGDPLLNHLHPVGGLGIRGIAQPFIVGYVDIGYGGEGVAIFSGINYPF